MEKSSNQKIYTDILVIGGGVMGTASAYYLSRRGFKVTVVEKSSIATGASGACDGFLFLQSKRDPDIISLTKKSLKYFSNLSDELSYDIEYDRCGGLVIFSGLYNGQEVTAFHASQKKAGINTRVLDKNSLSGIEPFISKKITFATFCEEEGQVNPIALNYGFYLAAKKNGVKFLTSEAAESFTIKEFKSSDAGLRYGSYKTGNKSDTVSNEGYDTVSNEDNVTVSNEDNATVSNEDNATVSKEGNDTVSNEDNVTVNKEGYDTVSKEDNDTVSNEDYDTVNNEGNDTVINKDSDTGSPPPEQRERGVVLPKSNVTREVSITVTSSGAEIIAGQVLICAGAWSGEVGKLLGIDIPVRPRRGNLIVTEVIPAAIMHAILDYDYICCKFDENRETGFTVEQTRSGNLLIGSVREFKDFEDGFDNNKISRILKRAVEILPLLSETSIIRIFSGFRPFSEDFKPLIGPIPGFSNLWIASGHEGDGIALSCATGKLISAMIESDDHLSEFDGININRFLPSRFKI